MDLPAHASPGLDGSELSSVPNGLSLGLLDQPHTAPPPALLSPSFTPPSTPGTGTPAVERDAPSIPIDVSQPLPKPKLLESLPSVNCVVRARIPTTTGQEMFLHLYQNNIDNKEHLAIVFGPHIRSRSLDKPRPGETELDRMIRGAYTGRLYPGRTTSSVDSTTATASPLRKSLHKQGTSIANGTTTGTTVRGTHTVREHKSESGQTISADARIVGQQRLPQSPLVRIHSECYTGETVWSARCDCGEQLDEAARLMSLPSAQESGGVIVYLRQEGRGIGLSEKLKAYNLQDLGSDTVEANLLLRHPADARSYGLATAILIDLGLGTEATLQGSGAEGEGSQGNDNLERRKGIRLLTNNPDKIRAIEGPSRDVIVEERVPMIPIAWRSGGSKGVLSPEVSGYLKTKVCTLCTGTPK